MEQKEYWDSVSGKKQFTTPFHAESFSKYVNPNDKILDIYPAYLIQSNGAVRECA